MQQCPRSILLASLALSGLAGCTSLFNRGLPEIEAEAAHAGLIVAFNGCDEASFTSAYSETFTFTTSNTRQAYTTVASLRGYLAASCRQKPSPRVTLKSQSVRLAGDVVLLTGQYTFRLASGDLTQNFTLAMQREGSAWRVVAHHVSPAP